MVLGFLWLYLPTVEQVIDERMVFGLKHHSFSLTNLIDAAVAKMSQEHALIGLCHKSKGCSHCRAYSPVVIQSLVRLACECHYIVRSHIPAVPIRHFPFKHLTDKTACYLTMISATHPITDNKNEALSVGSVGARQSC